MKFNKFAALTGSREVTLFLKYIEQTHYEDWDQFLVVLCRQLRAAKRSIEDAKHLHRDSSEDQITRIFYDRLSAAGFAASTGTTQSGETDLRVDPCLLDDDRKFVAEAKFTGSALIDGVNQLVTRYRNTSDSHGGYLIYSRYVNLGRFLEAWPKKVVENFEAKALESDRTGEFLFEHSERSISFEVMHFVVDLFFKPEDASGRDAEKHDIEVEHYEASGD